MSSVPPVAASASPTPQVERLVNGQTSYFRHAINTKGTSGLILWGCVIATLLLAIIAAVLGPTAAAIVGGLAGFLITIMLTYRIYSEEHGREYVRRYGYVAGPNTAMAHANSPIWYLLL